MATGFVQIIEFRSSRIDEVRELISGWEASIGSGRTATRALITADRDAPGTYVHIIEFPSYEEAMANSSDPATAKFAEQFRALCEGEMSFRNLDTELDMTFG